jgi:hypothetical protein
MLGKVVASQHSLIGGCILLTGLVGVALWVHRGFNHVVIVRNVSSGQFDRVVVSTSGEQKDIGAVAVGDVAVAMLRSGGEGSYRVRISKGVSEMNVSCGYYSAMDSGFVEVSVGDQGLGELGCRYGDIR